MTMQKLIDVQEAKEFASTFLADPILKMAVNAVLDNAPAVTDTNVGGKWIPVTERLPEYETPVIGWDAELRDMGIVNFIYGKFLDIIDMCETNVTHWMPLPEPPKGD